MCDKISIEAHIDKNTGKPISRAVIIQKFVRTGSNVIQRDILVLPVVEEINRPYAKRLKYWRLRCW